MPVFTGIDVPEKIYRAEPDLPVLLMTAHAAVDVAVDAIKKGAFDFIIKPYRSGQLIHPAEKAVKHWRLGQKD